MSEAKVKVISELEMIAEPTEEVNGEVVLGDSLAGSFRKRFAFQYLSFVWFSILSSENSFAVRSQNVSRLCV